MESHVLGQINIVCVSLQTSTQLQNRSGVVSRVSASHRLQMLSNSFEYLVKIRLSLVVKGRGFFVLPSK